MKMIVLLHPQGFTDTLTRNVNTFYEAISSHFKVAHKRKLKTLVLADA